MAVSIVFETHSITEDNENGIATGWLPGKLSAEGRRLASELGKRRCNDGLAAVFTSDLARAVETVGIAFDGVTIPVFHDWRLRECNYGDLNGHPASRVHADRARHLDTPYPHGESWRQAVARVRGFLDDLPGRWGGERILVVGHVATRWALDHYLAGVPLEDMPMADFAWQEGWEYTLAD